MWIRSLPRALQARNLHLFVPRSFETRRRFCSSSISSSARKPPRSRRERTPSRQLIRDTILDNARECRSSSESAANGSQLISVYYSTGVRARGLESVRKYGRTGPRPRPQRGERKLLLHTPNTLSAFSRPTMTEQIHS